LRFSSLTHPADLPNTDHGTVCFND
jgi:hypothetical protein